MDITTSTLQELINKRAEVKAKAEIDVLVKAMEVSGLFNIQKIFVTENDRQRDLTYCLADKSFKIEDNILTRLYNKKVNQYIISETKDFVDKVERLVNETDNLLNIAENF